MKVVSSTLRPPGSHNICILETTTHGKQRLNSSVEALTFELILRLA